MRIRYKTGIEDHVSNELGRALINSGQAEQIVDATAPGAGGANTTPKWSVEEIVGVERTFLAIKMVVLNRTQFYSGKPDAITDRAFGWPVASIPKQILAEYKQLYRDKEHLRDKYADLPGYGIVGTFGPSGENQTTAGKLAGLKSEGR